MTFIWYPKCSTCQKAKSFLDNNNISYEERLIKEEPITIKEIDEWIKKELITINKLFNTSGLVYRNLNLKEKMNLLSLAEKERLLASNPMLVKRPLLVLDDKVLAGFKPNEWEKLI